MIKVPNIPAHTMNIINRRTKEGSMKNYLVKTVFFALLISIPLSGLTSPGVASGKEIKLKAVHFLPAFMDVCKDFIELTKRINSQTEGELQIKVLGGPDVIPPPEQAEALRKGIIDCLMCPTEYYKGLLPEATVFHLGTLTPAEERESGFYDFMVERHKSFGIFYVGRTRAYDPFFVYLKKKIEKPEDFAGLKIGRSAPLCSTLYKSFGASVVTVQAGDFYSALERSVVDGVGHPSDGMTGLSLPEVAEYLLAEPVYLRNSTVFLMNLDQFNKLPGHIQKIIIDTTIAWENERVAIDAARVEKELGIGKQKGLKFINFSEADSKKFSDRAFQVEWDVIKDKQPDLYPELKKLLKQ